MFRKVAMDGGDHLKKATYGSTYQFGWFATPAQKHAACTWKIKPGRTTEELGCFQEAIPMPQQEDRSASKSSRPSVDTGNAAEL